VEDLHDDGGRAADREARHVAVDLPRHAGGATRQAGVARRAAVDLRLVVATSHRLELVDDAALEGHPRSMTIDETVVN